MNVDESDGCIIDCVKEEEEFPSTDEQMCTKSETKSDEEHEPSTQQNIRNRKLTYECEYCNRRFSIQKSWENHQNEHKGDRPYQCVTCGMSFALSSTLNGHRKIHKNKTFKCTICDKLLYTKQGFKNHMVQHTGDRPFACHLCDEQFMLHIQLKRHLDSIHMIVKHFGCTLCNKKFIIEKDLEEHVRYHPDHVSRYNCTECDKSYTRKSTLRIHILWKHGSNCFKLDADDATSDTDPILNEEIEITNNPVDNQSDDNQFVNVNDFQNISIAPSVDTIKKEYEFNQSGELCSSELVEAVISSPVSTKPARIRKKVIHNCKYCEKTFTSGTSVKDHENLHTGEKPNICKICGMSFHHGSSLRKHSKIHIDLSDTVRETFECDVCGRMLLSKQSITEHMRLHTNERPFVCEVCDVRHISSRQLSKHYKRYHLPNDGTDTVKRKYFKHSCTLCPKQYRSMTRLSAHIIRHNEVRTYTCPTCGDIFKHAKNLRVHNNVVHLKIKNFTCPICGQKFSFKDGLTEHMRSHTGERPFLCDLCEKTFMRKRNFQRHLLTHNKILGF